MSAPLIYLIAGEASGDALGVGLMRALKVQQPEVRFAGIGGEAMQREGLQSLFPHSELSIMGFWEVVPHIPALLRRLKQTMHHIEHLAPDAVVTIDSPGFCFRLARMLKENPKTQSIKRIHYVAPSVWAYKPGRARKTAQLFDALLALLSFEPPYFEKEGLPTTCVGHPVLWETPKGNAQAFRARHSIDTNQPLLLILPGSRAGEVRRMLPVFLEAAKVLPDYRPVILASPQVEGLIRQIAGPQVLIVGADEKHDAFAAASMALSKSGTITLELAVADVPMVVAHKVTPLSAWLIRRMLLIRYASLVNIAVDKEVVPELIQEQCTAENIGRALLNLAEQDFRDKQRLECAASLQVLRAGLTENPHTVAARTILDYLRPHGKTR